MEIEGTTLKTAKPMDLPDAVLEVMHSCALRFDGYRWLSAKGTDPADNLESYMEPVVHMLRPHATVEGNFAAFFALQRWLFKWGGERLPLSSPEHTAFRFLFLKLMNEPTPRGFEHPDYERRWQGLDQPRVQRAADYVRRMLIAEGNKGKEATFLKKSY